MTDYINMATGSLGVSGAAHGSYAVEVAAAVELYEERMGRPMTAVEADAVAEAERAALRKDAVHAYWLACRDAKPGEVVGGK